ncbi:DNA polymerase III subunit gamma/tau [Desulfovibrio sp.]|uniref:DNA polymerase III subunit gamma/tau n=1 Tax=Desulfovibrio sp. TaxID=885 RepID=UPI0025C66496|nr:DNA polymerase III subunit gamma/tau [Desulfovibrio sp.]
MKKLSLAARYRPQTFAEVAGQDMVKTVLSRAAAEDKVAAAYLLSGTRGVGKTTIARIFAKALNCEHAPTAEPCNQCAQCRKITQGSHVDVAEIDGASNNSVEDARALRETIGYAPMEGRYKVFIIDEAHMLSRSAFNALLKTLEEPPARVVFIFATTEAHKFPITIVSRCQHFVFRHLSEEALAAHLTSVLQREGLEFEESAVRILARRAAGSVRDSMSLLDQVLALGGDRLTAAVTRQVLGLAGQELFQELFDAVLARDCAALTSLCRGLLHRGVDVGFFVRELSQHLRDLFLLRQGGTGIISSLNLPADEAALWQGLAPRFSPGHLHAAWQMTLDAQRGIVQNPDPATALELLLLNMALLPQLLPLENLVPGTQPAPQQAPAQAAAQPAHTAQPTQPASFRAAPPAQQAQQATQAHTPQTAPTTAPRPSAPTRNEQPPRPAQPVAATPPAATPHPRSAPPSAAPETPPQGEGSGDDEAPPPAPASTASRDWDAFCAFCADTLEQGGEAPSPRMLRQLSARWDGARLILTPHGETLLHQVERQRSLLEKALAAYGAGVTEIELVQPRPMRTEAELIEECSRKPELQDCLAIFDGRVDHCRMR